MSKNANLIGVVVLLLIFVLAAADLFGPERYIKLAVLAFVVAGIAWLAYRDRLREKEGARQIAAEDEKRFLDLSGRARNQAFRLAVSGPSGLSAVLAGFVIGSAALFVVDENPLLGWSVLVVVFIVGSLLLSRVIFVIGKPVITIAADGFETPLTPRIPWEAVDGISLHAYHYRGGLLSQQLLIRSESLPEYLSRGTRSQRFFSRMRLGARRTAAIELINAKERADVVYRLARFLWTQKTGRDYDWNPMVSEHLVTALRQIHQLQAAEQSGHPVQHDPQELEHKFREINRNIEIAKRKSRFKLRTIAVLQILVVASFVAYLVLHFFRVV